MMLKQWYNVRADMKKETSTIVKPGNAAANYIEELSGIFCTELAKQELDDTTAYFDIPEEIEISIRCIVHFRWFALLP